MKGETLSEGLARGTAHKLSDHIVISTKLISKDETNRELDRFRAGREIAVRELNVLIDKVRREMGEEKAEIFEGHLEIVTSEDLEDEVSDYITNSLFSAERAVMEFAETNARDMEALEDEYFRERGQDFRDIGKQIVNGITGNTESGGEIPQNAILISEELTPSQTASLDFSRIQGIVIENGGKNSHAAIIARTMEIPALLIRNESPLDSIDNGSTLYLDGESGELWINPGEDVIAELEKKRKRLEREKEALMELLPLEPITTDGYKCRLFANVGGEKDIESACRYNADGIGLFRTEFLFMESGNYPTLERQIQVYTEAAKAMKGKKVIIRLLDTGADKPLPYWPLPEEENPFLGIRGIRLLLQKEEILRTQIQALIVASDAGPIGMMIPMVGRLKPIERVRQILDEELTALNRSDKGNLTLGVMVETPSAVQLIRDILDMVDFISIGTNDLTQYMLAADRGNPGMDEYYDEFHPAVLRSIAHVIKQAKKKNKFNGICGELAGNELALPFFIGLGVDELSGSPSNILKLKKIIRKSSGAKAQLLVEEILRIPASEGIQARLNRFLRELDE